MDHQQHLFNTHHQELITRRASLGAHHPLVAETLNTLGLVHHHITGNQNEALQCHKEALQIFSQLEGSQYVMEVAITLSDIGDVHWKSGECDYAEDRFEESLKVFKMGNVREDHPRVHSILNRLEKLRSRCWSPSPVKRTNSAVMIRSPSSIRKNVSAEEICRNRVALI